MRPTLLRVSAQPSGWSMCRTRGRRRPVRAWGIFREDGGRETVAGLVASGQTLVRADDSPAFAGYAAGPGTEAQLEPPALPPADLDAVMTAALEVRVASWEILEVRIRSGLTAAADIEWATTSLAGFDVDPRRWFRLWLLGRLEHEATERDLMLRLRALALVAPGVSLEEALDITGVSLGALLAAPPPLSTLHEARRRPGRGEDQL